MENKWLMINIQNVQDFACQCLNRDVWSNDAVKNIIREHFIFWQVCQNVSSFCMGFFVLSLFCNEAFKASVYLRLNRFDLDLKRCV